VFGWWLLSWLDVLFGDGFGHGSLVVVVVVWVLMGEYVFGSGLVWPCVFKFVVVVVLTYCCLVCV